MVNWRRNPGMVSSVFFVGAFIPVPSIYDLKPRFQVLLRPLCRQIAQAGVRANHVTLAAFFMSGALGLAIYFTNGAPATLWALAPFLFLRMALNAIDGMLAREFGQETKLGAILNELTDVLADAALYLPFAVIAGLPATVITLIVVLGIITEMTGVVAVQIGGARRYDGPFGKSDRALMFGALALLLAAGVAPGRWSNTVFAVACLLSAVTIFTRARAALKEVSP